MRRQHCSVRALFWAGEAIAVEGFGGFVAVAEAQRCDAGCHVEEDNGWEMFDEGRRVEVAISIAVRCWIFLWICAGKILNC